MSNEPAQLDNPYAAPQAELRVSSRDPRFAPRFQTSIMRNALRLTLGVNLIFIVVMVAGSVFAELKDKQWLAMLDTALAGALFATVCCWPIGIVCGLLAMCWDYLLQLIGWRTYDAPQTVASDAIAEEAPTKNPYGKY